MNEYDVKRLALVLAIQAEIEGMKAQNDQQKHYGAEMLYTYQHFADMANQLNELAHKHNEQL